MQSFSEDKIKILTVGKKPARPRWKIINEAAFGLLGCWLAVIDARREAAFVCIRFSVPRLVSAAERLQRHAAMVQRRHFGISMAQAELR